MACKQAWSYFTSTSPLQLSESVTFKQLMNAICVFIHLVPKNSPPQSLSWHHNDVLKESAVSTCKQVVARDYCSSRKHGMPYFTSLNRAFLATLLHISIWIFSAGWKWCASVHHDSHTYFYHWHFVIARHLTSIHDESLKLATTMIKPIVW